MQDKFSILVNEYDLLRKYAGYYYQYSGVLNISVGANNSVGRHNFPKFNNSVGDLLTK